MPIRAYLGDQSLFTPDAIDAMSQALEEACAVLAITDFHPGAREMVAARIIHLARTGMIDANALRNRVVLEARPSPEDLTA